MRKLITQKTLDHLPSALDKRIEIRDTLLPGFMIRISKSGGAVWYLATRVNGEARRIKIGDYPILQLAEARSRARELLSKKQLGQLDIGNKPIAQNLAPTLSEVIPQFIELYAKPRNRAWKGTRPLLEKFAVLGKTPIAEIKRKDVVAVLDSIVANGTPVRANRALAAIKKLFAWCVDRGMIEHHPLVGLALPARERARDRVLSDLEISGCWNTADREGCAFAQLIKILILTGQRRGEVQGMRWSELDLKQAVWTIPMKRAKNATQHTVPLAPLAVEILESMPRFLGSDLVFTTNGKTPVSGFGRLKVRLDKDVGAIDWRMHDIRRTVATGMAKLRVAPHVIEAVLNHKNGLVSGVAAVYNRYAYADEKREALQLWSNHVARLSRSEGPREEGTKKGSQPLGG